MIIRKPYAFLIKHFRKIHILLFVLCGYIYYKNLQLSSFVKEFMNLGTYDAYAEPISDYVTKLSTAALILLIVGSIVLLGLLRYKHKPWKLYILPIFEYLLILFVFYATKSFFNNYTGELQSASIRAIRDFLFIGSLLQYPTMAIFLVRILGLDLKKFNFKMDEEYLELENNDREELEINIEFDKAGLKRTIKRLIRNSKYVYQEHKITINCAIGLLTAIFLVSTYRYVFITNKTFKEGQILKANGYNITINNSYYTDKDYRGKVISKKSSFVVLDLTITNTLQKRKIDLNKFHLMNGISNFTTTEKTYGTEFQDYGKTYDSKELKENESFNLIMVFKVDKKLSEQSYVLYYQGFNGNEPHLRKIKLNLNNVSKIKKNTPIKLNEKFTFTLKNKKETIIFDDYEFLDTATYSYRICSSSTCTTHTENYTSKPGYKILKISFASTEFEGKDMIDFSRDYGTINYIYNKDKMETLDIKNPFNRVYHGKYLYISVPENITEASSVELNYTIRDNKYIYKLK